ncbi:MAG: translation initiation factor [Sphingobacteriales bacterium]|nr:MAG: translation initiation factor [Sphingobacteriales bacterium]
MAKNKWNPSGIVYSTNPDFKPEAEELTEKEINLQPFKQKIRVKMESKHRAGKAVTLVEGFLGTEEEKIELGRKLKTFCGTGGSVKDGEIIVQGDNRDKVVAWFHKNGYIAAKKV